MFKKALTASAIVLASSSAMAEWTGGVSYANLSDNSLDFGALVGSVGYTFKTSENFSLVPELRYGIGISDDTYLGVDFELDRFLSLSVRGEFDFNNGAYAFIAPSYSNVKLEGSSGGFSASADDSEFGIGAGVGYFFDNNIAIEASYENIDQVDVFSAGLKFKF